MLKYAAGLGVILTACGGWSDADTKSATDAVRAQLMIETMCSPSPAAADACVATQVRALERVSYCSNASMLARHGQTVPDGGSIACQPR